ncbi:Arfaptiny (AH) domain/BAR domain containing protein [Cryptosporidium felis]|nr:Arfaptiny (AH) domain/BAR domain containing protein [Cryptosporidium felis]
MMKFLRRVFSVKKIANDPLESLTGELENVLRFSKKVQTAIDKSVNAVTTMCYSKDLVLAGIGHLFPQEAIEYGSLMNAMECIGGLSTARDHFMVDCDQVKILVQEMVLNVNSIQKRLVKRRIAYSERIHYEKKLKKRQQRMNSGKSISLSDNAKLDRTQRKCGDALDEFTRIDDDVQQELQQFLTKSHEMAMNIISKYNFAIGSFFSFVFSHYDNLVNGELPTNNLIIPDQPQISVSNSNSTPNSNLVVSPGKIPGMALNSATSTTASISNPVQAASNSQHPGGCSSMGNINTQKLDSTETLTRAASTCTLKKSDSGSFSGVEFASRRHPKNSQQNSGSIEINSSKA